MEIWWQTLWMSSDSLNGLVSQRDWLTLVRWHTVLLRPDRVVLLGDPFCQD